MDAWQYDTSPDLDQSLTERLRTFPREPDLLIYSLRSFVAIGVRSWLKIYHRFQVTGRENLPSEGSYVLVANHTSHLDALTLAASLPLKKLHRAFPAAAEDYFFKNMPRTFLAAALINALPFNREVGFRQSIKLCHGLLENEGNILFLFPEGTRSVSGELGDFKPGIGMLLAGINVPVLPCYLCGAHAAWPKGAWLPRPRKLHLRIGAARRYDTLKPGKQAALTISRELHDAVRELGENPQ